MAGERQTLTDHDAIRQWAEARGAHPACVKGTGARNDVGMIRLDFPGYSGEESLQTIDWDRWFEKFDESSLALIVQEETSSGEQSFFNKLIRRPDGEPAGASTEGRSRSRRAANADAASSDEQADTSNDEDEASIVSGMDEDKGGSRSRSAGPSHPTPRKQDEETSAVDEDEEEDDEFEDDDEDEDEDETEDDEG